MECTLNVNGKTELVPGSQRLVVNTLGNEPVKIHLHTGFAMPWFIGGEIALDPATGFGWKAFTPSGWTAGRVFDGKDATAVAPWCYVRGCGRAIVRLGNGPHWAHVVDGLSPYAASHEAVPANLFGSIMVTSPAEAHMPVPGELALRKAADGLWVAT